MRISVLTHLPVSSTMCELYADGSCLDFIENQLLAHLRNIYIMILTRNSIPIIHNLANFLLYQT